MRPTIKLALTLWTVFTAEAAQQQTDLKLSVRVYDQTGLPDKVLGTSESLARHIFRRAGIETEWIRCPKDRQDEDRFPRCQDAAGAENLVVQIVPGPLEGYEAHRNTFGLTLPSPDGRPARYAYLFRLRLERAAEENGHVSMVSLLAHAVVREVGHLLLGADMRFERGVMQAGWQREHFREMECGGLMFTDEQARLLRTRVAQRNGMSKLFADSTPDFFQEFSTAKYIIGMRVSFPAPYEGRRLSVYRSTDPENENCLSRETGKPGCTENFVGAIALVGFTVSRSGRGTSPSASIREVITVLEQSPGLREQPPFAMTAKLADGMGSDLQAFGYDESPVPPVHRPAARDSAKAWWRHCRQELYMDKDQQPFAVVEWLHRTTGIRILRVEAPQPRRETSESDNRRTAAVR